MGLYMTVIRVLDLKDEFSKNLFFSNMGLQVFVIHILNLNNKFSKNLSFRFEMRVFKCL